MVTLITSNLVFLNLITGQNPKCSPETWSSYDSECCSASNPCGVGQGDCGNDDECFGNLECGNNNCGDLFPSPNADCCVEPAGGIRILFTMLSLA